MMLLRHLRVFAVALPLYGCIVVVSPFEVDEHCGIAGDTACSKCIRTICQTSIDACCKSTTCSGASLSPILDAVDDCGRGDKNACVSKLGAARVTAEDEAVRACVANECKAECVEGGVPTGPSVQPTWSCAASREDSTACGACIYGSCSSGIDECCANASCSKDSDLSKDMGACIAGDAPGCAYGLSDERGLSGLDGVVRGCIAKNCADKCVGDGLTHQSCNLYDGGNYCSCRSTEQASGPECSAAKVGGKCVRANKGCICGEYSCSAGSSGGCSCGFKGDGGGTECELAQDAEVCCLQVRDTDVVCSCSKYTSSCYGDDYQIASCSQPAVFSFIKSLFVDVCSR